MSKLTFTILFSLWYMLGSCQRNALVYTISKEHQDLDRIFNNQIFFDVFSDSAIYFKIQSIDSSTFYINEPGKRINTVNIYKVGITFDKNNVLNLNKETREILSKYTFYYYLISYDFKYYKLFGFYTTDINIFYNRVGKKGLSELNKHLINKRILSKKESHIFTNSILKDKEVYSYRIHKPVVLLDLYFTGKDKHKSNTIILPLEPLIPYSR